MPVTYLQSSIGNAGKNQSELQRFALKLLPVVNVRQPSDSSHLTVGMEGRNKVKEWMKLRRQNEELRKQFGQDIQLLFDTYYSVIQHGCDEMREIEESSRSLCVCSRSDYATIHPDFCMVVRMEWNDSSYGKS